MFKDAKLKLDKELHDHFRRQLVAPKLCTRALGQWRGFAMSRPDGSNDRQAWGRAVEIVGEEFAEEYLAIRGMVRLHEGEFRVWQLGPEKWVRVLANQLTMSDLVGSQHKQASSSVEVWAASGAVFPRGYITDGICNPDFKDPISNVACMDKDKTLDAFCLRDVRAVSLPELFVFYMHETSFEDLVAVFLDCPVLISDRFTESGRSRGTRAGKAASSAKGEGGKNKSKGGKGGKKGWKMH